MLQDLERGSPSIEGNFPAGLAGAVAAPSFFSAAMAETTACGYTRKDEREVQGKKQRQQKRRAQREQAEILRRPSAGKGHRYRYFITAERAERERERERGACGACVCVWLGII